MVSTFAKSLTKTAIKEQALLLALTAALTISFYSCKKENSQPAPSPTTTTQAISNPKAIARLSSGTVITVDTRGYLVFGSSDAMEALIKSITEGTHAEAKAFFGSNGFSSKALSIFDASFDNQTVSETQAPYYIISALNTVQVNGVIMKLTADNQAVLTLTGDNITNANYQELVADHFVATAMNRFATNLESEEQQADFLSYNQQNPTGFDNTGTTTPTPSALKFGWFRESEGRPDGSWHTWDGWYCFGIRFGTRNHEYYP